jgi:hypothetical protein
MLDETIYRRILGKLAKTHLTPPKREEDSEKEQELVVLKL